MNEEVRRIMTQNPITLHPEDSIDTASKHLQKSRIHHLPVVDAENLLVGMVTYHDIHNRTKDQKNIGEIMNTKTIKITPIDKVGTAAELFLDRRFHALPVVNLHGELKGMVTSFDVLKYTFKKEYKTPILYKEVLTSS